MTDFTPRQLVLEAGILWLCATVQPDGAIDSHHGQDIPNAVVDNRSFWFVPSGYADRPVLIVQVAKPEYTDGLLVDGVTPPEMDAVEADLAAIGVRCRHRWNGGEDGFPADSGSFALDVLPHPSLLAAVARYRAGCPSHGSVFCGKGWATVATDEDTCTWFRDGNRLLVLPTSPLAQPVAEATDA
jgi:hypothetical protein